MTDFNPFETSTLAVVADMSPEERVFGPAPLPVFEPPSVMDPVSNLDFLPVDDAFALEFRSETIAQLVGGDALRRGVSERIEAGRSQTNADLVAGRDRVRVHGTLDEHTGHGLAEQGAHLHTTVDGTLDVHAASEDTVLLAGHMSELWDGGAAIVAAMTDDTVAGGGIRVTAPLDLWVHGLMGVEERIGTCTADAVLMELGATHYEREYGPGVHAAGLAVYTGSLYQSSRSTFRPLMRVSSGVRNLIAGGGGGGGGGDPVRPASIGFEQWKSFYTRLRSEFRRHRQNSNWIATRAYGDAISMIDNKIIEAYVESGGHIDALDRHVWYDSVPFAAYGTLRDLASEADGARDINRASRIEQLLASINRLTVILIDELDARTDEFDRAYVEAKRMRSLDPRIDVRKANDVIGELIEAGKRRRWRLPSSVRSRRSGCVPPTRYRLRAPSGSTPISNAQASRRSVRVRRRWGARPCVGLSFRPRRKCSTPSTPPSQHHGHGMPSTPSAP